MNKIDESVGESELIAAVGAGRMGRGIAITFALAGYNVRLVDVKKRSADDFDALCEDARREISATLAMNEAARMVEEGVATAEAIDTATRYGFGFRFAVLGLLEFIDWGGGDILYYASRYMTDAMGSERYAAPDIIERNMREERTGLKTGKGFLDYSDMNIPEYQRAKLSDFIALLRHIGKLPVVPDHESDGGFSEDACLLVRQYLNAMECRELAKAQTFLAQKFQMTFPGNVTFSSLQSLVEWSSTRYQSISKTYHNFDQSQSDGDTIVYCSGTLQGVWLDGSEFSGIRFIDRFVIHNGLIVRQEVWNDLAELSVNT